MDETPICDKYGCDDAKMELICNTGTDIQIGEGEGLEWKLVGMRPEQLYQCANCKLIKAV